MEHDAVKSRLLLWLVVSVGSCEQIFLFSFKYIVTVFLRTAVDRGIRNSR